MAEALFASFLTLLDSLNELLVHNLLNNSLEHSFMDFAVSHMKHHTDCMKFKLATTGLCADQIKTSLSMALLCCLLSH